MICKKPFILIKLFVYMIFNFNTFCDRSSKSSSGKSSNSSKNRNGYRVSCGFTNRNYRDNDFE